MEVVIVMNNDREQLIKLISDELLREDTILYIGSGVSCWSGLPSWSKLLSEMVEFIKSKGYSYEHVQKAIDNNNLLYAASLGKAVLSTQEYAMFLKSVIDGMDIVPSCLHEILVRLGCSNYITTNYDKLIEMTLGSIGKKIQVVSNRQLIELPNIMQFGCHNYVFKAHGDIDDIESIILTKEDYAKLYSEQSAITTTLKTLFLSRTIIFIGFGLLDPDFEYIKNTILNTYNENQIIHYAIMPDVHEEEKKYWMKNYGIRILSYDTIENSDKSRNHSELASILEKIRQLTEYKKNKKHQLEYDSYSMSLLRFLAKMQYDYKKNDTAYDLYAQKVEERKKHSIVSVEELLKNNTKGLKIIANPGMGKSYTLTSYCSYLSDVAIRHITLQNKHTKDIEIPIYIDMKYFEGSISAMIDKLLPKELKLADIIQNNKVVIVIDSINEVPKIYWENGKLENELLDCLNKFSKNKIVFASRTGEGLEKISLDKYEIIGISYNDIRKYSSQNSIDLNNVNLDNLRSPLLLKLLTDIADNKCEIKSHNTFFEILFENLEKKFEKRFDIHVSFIDVFSEMAYKMIKEGIEVFSYKDLVKIVEDFDTTISKIAIVNWFLEDSHLLVVSTDYKLNFFHQSITEFLAAQIMLKKLEENNFDITDFLKSKKWDNSMLITCHYLDDTSLSLFFEKTLEVDCILAIQSIKYMQADRRDYFIDKVCKHLLRDNLYDWETNFRIANLFKEIPFTEGNIEVLMKLVDKGNSLGGEASGVIVNLLGERAVKLLLPAFFDKINDFNFATRVGSLLKNYNLDLQYILDEISKVKCENIDSVSASIGILLSKYNINDIVSYFEPIEECGFIKQNILADLIRDNEGKKESAALAVNMIKRKISECVFSLYINLKSDLLDIEKLDENFFKSVESIILNNKNYWCIHLIMKIYSIYPNIKSTIFLRLQQCTGILKLVYLYCLRKDNEDAFINEFKRFLLSDKLDEYVEIIRGFENVDYSVCLDEFINILIEKNSIKAMQCFLNSIREEFENYVLSDDIIVQLINFASQNSTEDEMHWCRYLIGELILLNASDNTKKIVLSEFDNDRYRNFIYCNILVRFPDLCLSDFSKKSVLYLLNPKYFNKYSTSVLGEILNDKDVEEYIIPLYNQTSDLHRKNLLKNILERVGNKFQKRYII